MPHVAVRDESMRAAVDMRTLQFAPVKLTTTRDFVTPCTAATDGVFGVMQGKPNVGEAGRVAIQGRWPAKVDGSGTAIAIGDRLGPNAAGTMLVKKATADYSICATAQEVCTISGGIIDVDLFGDQGAVFRTPAG